MTNYDSTDASRHDGVKPILQHDHHHHGETARNARRPSALEWRQQRLFLTNLHVFFQQETDPLDQRAAVS